MLIFDVIVFLVPIYTLGKPVYVTFRNPRQYEINKFEMLKVKGVANVMAVWGIHLLREAGVFYYASMRLERSRFWFYMAILFLVATVFSLVMSLLIKKIIPQEPKGSKCLTEEQIHKNSQEQSFYNILKISLLGIWIYAWVNYFK